MYENFIGNLRLRRFTVLAMIIFVLFMIRDFMTPILLTFIFTLISVKIVKFIQRYIKAPTFLLATILYLFELWLLYLLISRYSTILIDQVVSTYNSIVHFYQHKEFNSDVVTNFISSYFKNHNWQDKVESGAGIILEQLQNVGRLAIAFIVSGHSIPPATGLLWRRPSPACRDFSKRPFHGTKNTGGNQSGLSSY